jgi:hypothetical protein
VIEKIAGGQRRARALHQKPTLAQALEKFSDPDVLASFDAAEADCGKWIRRRFGEEDIFLGPKPRGYQRV